MDDAERIRSLKKMVVLLIVIVVAMVFVTVVSISELHTLRTIASGDYITQEQCDELYQEQLGISDNFTGFYEGQNITILS